MKYQKGDEVQSISEPGRIGTIIEICEVHAGVQWYRVFFGGRDRPKISELDLRPHIASETPLEKLLAGKIDGYREFQRLITFQRLVRDDPLDNNIYAFNASKTRFFPYQFKPLLKFLNSPKGRLLIADEVGLGKTIEAGLILTEIRARQTTYRVLVVCPANLTEKWQWELKTRFGEDFKILNSRGFAEFLQDYGEPPHSDMLNGIISLESIRQDHILEQLGAVSPQFDLVIVDEAHHMRNFARKQRKAGLLLGENADAMLFLTATPIHLGNENLFSLLNILDDEEFPDFLTVENRLKANEPIVNSQICMGRIPANVDAAKKELATLKGSSWFHKDPRYLEILERLNRLAQNGSDRNQERKLIVETQRELAELNLLGHIFTRTKKRDVQENFPVRKAQSLPINLSPLEMQFYEAVTNFVREEIQRRADFDFVEKWILHMPQRRMASSMPAMVEYYRNNIGLEEQDKPEDYEFVDKEEGWLFNDVKFGGARERLKQIIKNWPAEGVDSKYDAFITSLNGLRRQDAGKLKVMVFAFFKDTLKYLSGRLTQDGFKNLIISGDVRPSDRAEIVNGFKSNPNYEILLSSKVGSEGLDFQFCNITFNYDLPWNPMEIEQRIGRLDRLGQESKVIRIFNFYLARTIEETIFKRLYERIGIFERSIGELEMILGEVLGSLEEEIFSRKLTPQQEQELVERKERILVEKQKTIKNLETEVARLIGTDQYFDEEVQGIIKKRRYVTADQMRQFILDFIKMNCPRARLAHDERRGYWRFYPDDEFRALILKNRKSLELAPFFSSYDEGVPLTFDSRIAYENPRIEFINVLHPLTQMIVNSYLDGGHLHSTVHHVALKTKTIAPGTYVYFIFRLRVRAARMMNTLEMTILDSDLEVACDDETAEILMGELVEKGEEPSRILPNVDRDRMAEAYNRAEDLFHERVSGIRVDAERNNNVFCDRRLESIDYSFSKQVQKKKEQLQRGESEGKKEQYLRLIRGRIQTLEAEWHEKKREIESLRTIEVTYDQVSAGIMEAIPQDLGQPD